MQDKPNSDSLIASKDAKTNIKKVSYTQEKLSNETGISIDEIKRFLGTKDVAKYPDGYPIKRDKIIKISECTGLPPIDIANASQWYYNSSRPQQFQLIIEDKADSFVGRKYAFDFLENCFKTHSKGYFTIVGVPGIGKSAIAAKYIHDHPEAICFFNIRAQGTNNQKSFFTSVRQQLIERYKIDAAKDDDLFNLLSKVSEKFTTYERLVIVIDALDEVDQESSGNLLHLPILLPERVYFLLTRRPYYKNENRLYFSRSVPTEELNLNEYSHENSLDIKEYTKRFINDRAKVMYKWIDKQTLTVQNFINKIAEKSENNFLYLYYILHDIAKGTDSIYNNMSFNDLPVGLIEYYRTHIELMDMTRDRINILYNMCVIRIPASCETIADLSELDNLTVQEVFNDWAQFLEPQRYQPNCLRFYHNSYIDFLESDERIQAYGVDLKKKRADLANKMTEGFFDGE